jgi:GxxExxY protein
MARIYPDRAEMDRMTGVVIGCAMTVLNTLKTGFLEKVYENALAQEIRGRGLEVAQQQAIDVRYNGNTVGAYFADLLVENVLVIELKVANALEDAHRAQCLNYLRATDLRLGLLLNFGTPRLGVRRVVNNL